MSSEIRRRIYLTVEQSLKMSITRYLPSSVTSIRNAQWDFLCPGKPKCHRLRKQILLANTWKDIFFLALRCSDLLKIYHGVSLLRCQLYRYFGSHSNFWKMLIGKTFRIRRPDDRGVLNILDFIWKSTRIMCTRVFCKRQIRRAKEDGYEFASEREIGYAKYFPKFENWYLTRSAVPSFEEGIRIKEEFSHRIVALREVRQCTTINWCMRLQATVIKPIPPIVIIMWVQRTWRNRWPPPGPFQGAGDQDFCPDKSG